jgi:hypothetical protein
MAKFIEKVIPLEVDADVWDADHPHVAVADNGDGTGICYQHEDQHQVRAGDVIVTYADGQVKPMNKDVFLALFTSAAKSTPPKGLPKGEE